MTESFHGAQQAGGQTFRLPGSSANAALHDQLYRYAEDFRVLFDSHLELGERYVALRQSLDSVMQERGAIDALMQSTGIMQLVTDPAGVILLQNKGAAAIAPALRRPGVALRSLVEPSNHGYLDLMLERLAHGGEPLRQRVEMLFINQADPNGVLITEVSTHPLRANGELRGIYWAVRDITSERETLFESQLYALAFSNALEGIMITDVTGAILSVNPAFTRITGYSAAEVIGKNPRILKSGVQDQAFYQSMWQTLAAEGQWRGQVSNHKKNGEIYTEWLSLCSSKDRFGEVLSYIAVFHDMTRLLEVQAQLARLGADAPAAPASAPGTASG